MDPIRPCVGAERHHKWVPRRPPADGRSFGWRRALYAKVATDAQRYGSRRAELGGFRAEAAAIPRRAVPARSPSGQSPPARPPPGGRCRRCRGGWPARAGWPGRRGVTRSVAPAAESGGPSQQLSGSPWVSPGWCAWRSPGSCAWRRSSWSGRSWAWPERRSFASPRPKSPSTLRLGSALGGKLASGCGDGAANGAAHPARRMIVDRSLAQHHRIMRVF